ncbi:unnamed protein product [Protopolystoma xenopodis]|uniref:Uncharacterized protein n=1 Tax=Protopolystoma xenopodis TaxID=117903 RepID=A0A3S5BAV6_9PLAT|nr:unnamed protein product [Protopolystoma xenopodis]
MRFGTNARHHKMYANTKHARFHVQPYPMHTLVYGTKCTFWLEASGSETTSETKPNPSGLLVRLPGVGADTCLPLRQPTPTIASAPALPSRPLTGSQTGGQLHPKAPPSQPPAPAETCRSAAGAGLRLLQTRAGLADLRHEVNVLKRTQTVNAASVKAESNEAMVRIQVRH